MRIGARDHSVQLQFLTFSIFAFLNNKKKIYIYLYIYISLHIKYQNRYNIKNMLISLEKNNSKNIINLICMER